MGKARKFSPEFKAQVVLEIVSGSKSLALASRKYQIKNTVLSRCKALLLSARARQSLYLPARARNLPDLLSERSPADYRKCGGLGGARQP